MDVVQNYGILTLQDLLLFPIYYFAIIFFLKRYIANKKDPVYNKYFVLGFKLKIVGMLLMAAITSFYFKSGDTFLYYGIVTNIYNNLIHNFSVGLEQIFINRAALSDSTLSHSHSWFLLVDNSSYGAVRLTGLISLITFNTYTCISLFIGLYTFWGLWNFFKIANRYSPNNEKINFIICFCLPTISIWASGILKDPYSIGGLGVCLNYLDLVVSNKKGKIKNLLVVIINAAIVLMTKDYTLYALLGAFAFAVMFNTIKNASIVFKIISYLILIPSMLFYVVIFFQNAIQEYLVTQVVETAITRQELWANGEGGSNYDLGAISPSLSGLAQLIPKAINVALFRPYVWESSNPFMFLEAILSSIGLFMLLYCFFKYGLLKSISTFFSNRFFIILVFYTLIFAFFVGLNTGNFGSLSRYRAPCLITYLLLIFNTISSLKHNKNKFHKVNNISV